MTDTSWITPNHPCWVEILATSIKEENSFIKSFVISYAPNDPTVDVYYEGQKISDKHSVKVVNVYPRNTKHSTDVEDMVNLSQLNDAELLVTLEQRYQLQKRKIFTYVGPTLLVVNPYELLQHLFNPEILTLYQSKAHLPSFNLSDLDSHIHAISCLAYRQIFENKKNQAIVISGESGAGKTENTKFAMKFLTNIQSLKTQQTQQVQDEELQRVRAQSIMLKKEIEDKILSCNPILEAFGNSKTMRNDNSSRFGKYVTLLINMENKRIKGAQIQNYLLEKSRIPTQNIGERNFHIFYFFLYGEDEQILKKYGFEQRPDPSTLNYLKISKCYKIENIDDSELFIELQDAFLMVGFSSSEEQVVWSIIASILHLGQIEFKEFEDNEGQKYCKAQGEHELKTISNLLKVDQKELEKCLTNKVII